jgi:hypothetical protein
MTEKDLIIELESGSVAELSNGQDAWMSAYRQVDLGNDEVAYQTMELFDFLGMIHEGVLEIEDWRMPGE